MRPVRVTGITGTSQWVPIDTYSPDRATALITGAGAIEYTLDNVFDTSITPQVVVLTLVGGVGTAPPGARALRGTGMAPADILTVSQQGIA